MSLSWEEFDEVQKTSQVMDERLKRLFGFNASTSNHYGMRRLYNQEIDSKTTDEELIAIRAAFVKWRTRVLALLAEKNVSVTDELWDRLFYYDCMFGGVWFLLDPLDIYETEDRSRERIERLLDDGAELDECEQFCRDVLVGNGRESEWLGWYVDIRRREKLWKKKEG